MSESPNARLRDSLGKWDIPLWFYNAESARDGIPKHGFYAYILSRDIDKLKDILPSAFETDRKLFNKYPVSVYHCKTKETVLGFIVGTLFKRHGYEAGEALLCVNIANNLKWIQAREDYKRNPTMFSKKVRSPFLQKLGRRKKRT